MGTSKCNDNLFDIYFLDSQLGRYTRLGGMLCMMHVSNHCGKNFASIDLGLGLGQVIPLSTHRRPGYTAFCYPARIPSL
jgi:hypothetical protein